MPLAGCYGQSRWTPVVQTLDWDTGVEEVFLKITRPLFRNPCRRRCSTALMWAWSVRYCAKYTRLVVVQVLHSCEVNELPDHWTRVQ